MHLIAEWSSFDVVICVDAALLLTAPGQIHRFDLVTEELPYDVSYSSSHAFGLPETIALARQLNQMPKNLIAYAIEGVSFAVGAGITPVVAAAAGTVVTRILADVATFR